MRPESENLHLIDPTSAAELASPVQKSRATISPSSQRRYESDMDSPYSQGIASSPSFGGSEDSVPALNLSGSPSPTSRRLSLISNASIPDSVPATPTSHLIEGARVDNDSDASPRYHRIHSTPYPKPRLPLQLTPHPQARVVSLPEWTRNRGPFLEAMRNLRSVSSPARFKRPPLSPPSAEDESIEFSGSSQSAASAVSFPALPEQESIGRSILSEQVSSLSVPREQFYTAPEGFFLTSPSFKSMVLSPITTGLERSLPQDRLLPPIREDESTCSAEPNSEDEVSLMLQRATIDTSSVYNRSSVSFSNTSRSSSPESVVFLSSIARVSRSFLGGTRGYQPITEASLAQESLDEFAYDSAAHDGGDGSEEYTSTETHIECPELESPQLHTDGCSTAQEKPEANVSKARSLATPIVSLSSMHHDPDWILFDPPRPIPALHGPPSLPYARCPSGAEGVVLDDQQELNGIVWGLSERDLRTHHPDEKRREASKTQQFMLTTKESPPARVNTRRIESNAAPSASETQSSKDGPRPLCVVVESSPNSSPNSKGKHVRFVDSVNEGKLLSQVYRTPAANTNLDSTSDAPEPNLPVGRDLARILFDQVEKARVFQSKPLRQPIPPPSRQETLDQLRRFGVPFRPHGLPTPPSTVSPKFVTQFAQPDPFLASSRIIQQANPRPLTAAYGPSLPKTFAQAAAQDKPMAAPLKLQDSYIPTQATASVPSSLSNIKSIPLLRLRQRQHAEVDSWRKNEKPNGEVALSAHDMDMQVEAGCNVKESSAPATRTSQLSAPCQTDSTSATTLPKRMASTSTNGPSPQKNRRQRGAGKRAPQKAAPALSESPTKENHQTAEPKSNADGRKPSWQTGRKKNRRTRTDSLPQNASRT